MTDTALDDHLDHEDPQKDPYRTFSIYQMCTEMDPADIRPRKFQVCPLVNNPQRDCYCLDMTSHNLGKMVRYCSGNYEQCAIYSKSRLKRPQIT